MIYGEDIHNWATLYTRIYGNVGEQELWTRTHTQTHIFPNLAATLFRVTDRILTTLRQTVGYFFLIHLSNHPSAIISLRLHLLLSTPPPLLLQFLSRLLP